MRRQGLGDIHLNAIENEDRKGIILWIGEEKNPIKINRKTDFVMDSVINYYKSNTPQLNYDAGKLFLDNGAFTARMKGVELDVDRVISVQESFMPDLTIPLDYPFLPGSSQSKMEKLWNKTAKNILYWQNSTRLVGRLVPALHSWNKSSLIENIKWLQKKADSDLLAIGTVVNPNFEHFKGYFGDRQPTRDLIDMISYTLGAIEKYSDFKVHLMGWGSSPLMLHLGYYLGIKSLDTIGHRRKAAYGKIILPGRGERHLGGSITRFGGNRLENTNSNDIQLLERCTCPICRINKYQLWSDWKARAIHNEWVMKQEAKLAEHFLELGLEEYEKYLDNIVFSKSSLRFLWEYTKLKRKYYRISDILFGG